MPGAKRSGSGTCLAKRLQSFKYWEALFTAADNQDTLDAFTFIDYAAEQAAEDGVNVSQANYTRNARRLQSRHRGTRTDHGGRRLDDNEPGWKYKAWVTPERIDTGMTPVLLGGHAEVIVLVVMVVVSAPGWPSPLVV
eukprot:Skav231692  [mRNA]  locus=scaffold597:1104412:1113193:+ [translate_table: standard]